MRLARRSAEERRTLEHKRDLSRGLPRQQDESSLQGLGCDARRRTARERTGRPRRLESLVEKHQEAVDYEGGPLGKTKRTSRNGRADIANEPTVFMVARAALHEAAKMFEAHPHFTIFPGEAVEVMPLRPVPGA